MAGQIEAWIKERRGDAAVVLSSVSVQQLLDAAQDPAAQASVREYFRKLQQAYDYELIAVFDSHGELLLTTSSSRLQQHRCGPGHVQAALRAAEAVFTDLHRGHADEPIHCRVLRQLKADPELRKIPIVILTTSKAEQDIVAAYECGACSYLVKPVDFPKFTALLEAFGFCWLAWNQFPHPPVSSR